MIIGHLPTGYIVSTLIASRFIGFRISHKGFILAGILGAIAPDLDMLYFYLVDHKQHHHHTYVSHYPILWIFLLFLSLFWFTLTKNKSYAVISCIFSLNGVIHMLLDTIVGEIWWLAPWVNKSFVLFTVPTLYKPWWLNFIFHWSFALELAIWALAIRLWRNSFASHNKSIRCSSS
jgi:hypothetical protein